MEKGKGRGGREGVFKKTLKITHFIILEDEMNLNTFWKQTSAVV